MTITAEQVARAIAGMREDAGAWSVLPSALGENWVGAVPVDVRLAWQRGEWGACIAALTRWHAELVAAERVRKVARWDAERGAYWLAPPHTFLHTNPIGITGKREEAIAWGYTIEGGPEPINDTAPERLRERREALGLDAAWIESLLDNTPITRKDGTSGMYGNGYGRARRCAAEGLADEADYDARQLGELRVRYAAALSAAEAEQAARKPATAHAAGHVDAGGAFVAGVGGCGPRQPAPEVVDVPQPAPLPKTVGHFYTIRALPEPHRVSWNMPGDGPQWVRVNDALWLHVDDLRAMLADIDAQQQPRKRTPTGQDAQEWLEDEIRAASEPTRPEPRYKVGDWVRVIGSRTIVFQVVVVQWFGHWVCIDSAGFGGAEDALTPALNPALHETARRTVAWLRGDAEGELLRHAPGADRLPGWLEWDNDNAAFADRRWAAQLERLLGDAP